MSDKKSWDGRFPGEPNEMYQWRLGVNLTLGALAHSIRMIPGADTAEINKIFNFLQESVAPKEKGSVDRIAFMSPVLALKQFQLYTPNGEPMLKDTSGKR